MTDLAICARGLGKRYTLGGGRAHNSLRELVMDRMGSILKQRAAARAPFWALRDVSFDIRRGENVGIIGVNGAGKSTLLKILSRITTPTTGTASIEGRVGSLLEVGTGFHGELTGRENLYLYGAILGMSRREIERKYDAIIAFAEIGDHIDTPLKRYSSGMYVRLAFSVAAHLEPEILILDEVMAVGDIAFQRKCVEFAKNLRQRNATILFVSHNMFNIKLMCSRVLLLRQGELAYDGPMEEGVRLYDEACGLGTLPRAQKEVDPPPIRITSCILRDEAGQERTIFDHGMRMVIRLAYDAREPILRPNFIVAFIRGDGVMVCNFSSEADGVDCEVVNGPGEIELRTPPLRLVADLYTIHILIRPPGFQEMLCGQFGGTFRVRHDLYDAHFGVFYEAADWRILPDCAESVRMGHGLVGLAASPAE